MQGVERTIRIHPRDSAYPPAEPGLPGFNLLCRSRRSGNGSPRSRLVLGRALRLDYFGDKAPIRLPALHQGLRFIDEGIGQRVAAYIAYGKGLPFPFENKINAASETVNAAGHNGAADTNPVR